MIFLDPKNDVAFKKLFSNKNVLIHFLNSVLSKEEKDPVVDAVIHILEEPRHNAINVMCTDKSGNSFIIELHSARQKNSIVQSQYYSAVAFSKQVKKGENSSKLVPVIFVGIFDGEMFAAKNYLSCHRILDIHTHECEFKNLEFHCIELAKFNKKEEKLTTSLDKWIYVLKNVATLEAIPENLKEPLFEEVFAILTQSNWSKKELAAYEKYNDEIRSAENDLADAKAEGMLAGKLAIAAQLLDVLDADTLAQKTGLSIDMIKGLKKSKVIEG